MVRTRSSVGGCLPIYLMIRCGGEWETEGREGGREEGKEAREGGRERGREERERERERRRY